MHKLERTLRIPITIDEAWAFFSSPDNLKKITPPNIGFDIKSGYSDQMYAGMIITYTVKPFLDIPVNWVSEITEVKDKFFFIDEQRKGPYAMWHHEHHFKAIPNGVEMTDIVNYKLPFGVLGKWLESILVRPKVQGIFDYRNKKMVELFGNYV
jgi:ligand-binding SRPBCC domain-containing protein